jgi:aspartyl protease family protein
MRMLVVFAGLALAIGGWLTSVADRAVPSQPRPAVAAVAVAAPAPAQTSGRSLTIPRDSHGHFRVDARVDGRRVGFMVDTGASTIALTEKDAGRLGVRPSRSEYTVNVKTANGTVKAAPVRINMVEIGGITVRDVQGLVVADNSLSENLLGMSFLSRLKRFEYANGKLVLEQ